eukprot:CAMPEP_0184508068 /NCGR_PEP_ID=MMETSP0198_2-20121128/569_1 /TAXON_ID=1112570 /ORGANISM="Thraustochytrium sp., Strain LLF1b" /LENGTH=76 /DNA_ID=CAMNT_0026897839 /DNA_START=96 /DNA_END=326 /DNA_ORIENTATION=+
MSAPVGNSFFRVAGLSYNQYVGITLNALTKVLKPDAAAKRKVDVVMRERTFQPNGNPNEKTEILDLFTKSPFNKQA